MALFPFPELKALGPSSFCKEEPVCYNPFYLTLVCSLPYLFTVPWATRDLCLELWEGPPPALCPQVMPSARVEFLKITCSAFGLDEEKDV